MVTLKDHHRQLIIEALAQIVEYKEQALRPKSWQRFHDDYLTSAIEQIRANEFILHHPTKNLFHWIIDQLVWSRQLISGVPINEGLPLIDTKLGQRVVEVCRAAAKGQKIYNSYCSESKYHDLFQ